MSFAHRPPRFVYLSDTPRGEDVAGRRFGWRLVAANNRPLGRSMNVVESLTACRHHADRIHRRITDAVPSTSLDLGRAHWRWLLELDGVAVAVSVHPYMRRVECVRALGQFVTAVGVADPEEGVIKHFGPHSLRDYGLASGPPGPAVTRT